MKKKNKKNKKNKKVSKESFFKRMGKNKGFVALAIIGVLLIVFFIADFVQSSELGNESEDIYSVHIVREEDPILFDGTVQAAEIQEEYYDASNGTIAEILVENGQSVEEGTELFTYTNEENQALLDEQNRQYSRLEERRSELVTDLANARNALETANANIAKSNQTIESASEVEVDEMGINPELEEAQNKLMNDQSDKAEAEAEIEGAEMSIRDLDDQMEDAEYEMERVRSDISSTVVAKVAGIVEMSETDVANLRTSEQPILRLMSHDLKIESTVSEYDYDKINVNGPVEIRLMTSDRELNGKISQVSALPVQSSDGATSSRYPFTVIPEDTIQYGFSVQIGVEEGIIYLPQSAVVEEDETMSVYVNNDGIAEKREVEVSEEGHIYVLKSGLKTDEEVILDPVPELLDGDEITVMYD